MGRPDKAAKVIEEFSVMRRHKAADLVERCFDETLGFCSYPQTHWIKIRTSTHHAGDKTPYA